MRIIIYGVGAVGGVLAARLSGAGETVIGIARGKQLEAIRADGLQLTTPLEVERHKFAVVASPAEIVFEPDDVICLTMKTQDTLGALDDLRRAGVTSQAIFCFQNGVSNEDMALRLFPNVFAVTVQLPATFIEPGVVASFFAPKLGFFDIGRHGVGDQGVAEQMAEHLDRAGFGCFLHADIWPVKYAKLLNNVGNAIDAALGSGAETQRLTALARVEATTVLNIAGIAVAPQNDRSALGSMHEIEGVARVGSSSAQSLARGAGSIETDYLNGEIILLGRKHGVPTPINTYFADVTQSMVAHGQAAGTLTLETLRSAMPNLF